MFFDYVRISFCEKNYLFLRNVKHNWICDIRIQFCGINLQHRITTNRIGCSGLGIGGAELKPALIRC